MTVWPTSRSRDGGIDQIPLDHATDLSGQLWLAGKHAVGPDPDSALHRVGASTVVCLNELHEFAERYPRYADWLRAAAPERAVWCPMPDLHVPSLATSVALVSDLLGRLRRGERLLMHCGAGIGRAGTFAVCILLATGMSQDDALATVARHRPMAGPEAGAQRELIAAFGQHVRATGVT